MAPASTVDRLNVRVPGTLTSEERAAWGRRAARSLREVNLDPPGLPPAAILVVRRLTDPLPRALFVGEPWQAAGTWGEAARASLGLQWRSAGRPFRRPVGSEAPAVWFADPAEWLACLSLDLRRKQTAQRWWWRSWLTQGPAAGGLVSLWAAEARWLPAALVLLAQRQADEAAEVVEALSEVEASVVRRAVVQEHRLPTRLADSRLDLDRCQTLLPGRRLSLPSERAPAELLALALLIGAAPALAHDPRLTVGHLTDASGPGAPPSDPDLPRAPTPEASSPNTSTARSATRPADQTCAGSALDAAPADTRHPFAAANDRRSASAERATGQAAEHAIRPSPSNPTRHPSDDLPVQIEDTERPPAPAAPVNPGDVTRESSPGADRADGQVVTPATSVTSDDDAATLSDWLPPDFDEVGIETGLGGIWYLVNLLVTLWLDDADAEPANAWSVLRALAAALLSGRPLTPRPPLPVRGRGAGGEGHSLDPIWSIFDHLSGPPEVPDPHPTLPLAGGGQGGGLPGLILRSRAWLDDAGFSADDISGLLCQPARLFVTRTHIDLIFRLDQIDLRARLAGLDRDPGWVPALGRVISFQYR